MEDYSNWREWKEIGLYKDQFHINGHHEYSKEVLFEILESLYKVAETQGLEGVFLKFESTMEPYEDYLGPVCITPCGYRRTSLAEKNEQKRQDAVSTLAKKLGVCEYEASTLMRLKAEGKIHYEA